MWSNTPAKFLVFIYLINSSSALGFGNVNTTETVGFVKEDNQRDTISLLISCFATLGLCVYSAVHLNVPRKADRSYWTLYKELQWCVMGLFAPELIIYTAWRQLASARQLRDQVDQARTSPFDERVNSTKILQDHDKSTTTPSIHTPWTITHGFYGGMGGFAIDLEHADSRYTSLFGNVNRLTLTAKGVALLAQCGYAPEISVDDIKDKNKADGLAKFLVCIQAGWMIIQVISRTAIGLPSTLLEVHVVAHVFCAMIMYVLWWHKPRQVVSPTILKEDWVWPLTAYMYLASRMSGRTLPGMLGKIRIPVPVLKELEYFEDVGAFDEGRIAIVRRDTAHTLVDGRFARCSSTGSSANGREPTSPFPEDESEMELRRLAAEAVANHPALRSLFTAAISDNEEGYSNRLRPYVAELVQPYALDWPNAGLLRRTQSLVMGMVLWGASMAYGAIHVAAWDYFFPTALEQLFWHLSSVWVTFCAGFWLLTNLLAWVFPFIDTIWVMYNERRLGWSGTGVITLLCILCGVSYIVSRGFLVVEAFVSIREVPHGVYETPAWSQVFPHL